VKWEREGRGEVESSEGCGREERGRRWKWEKEEGR
jgi:hypothetical protein